MTALVDSNTDVQELDPYTTTLPEVTVTAVSPQRKAIAKQLLIENLQSQP